ncbi:MFS transporter [Ochrobactrum sp. P6BS-III]|uniref:MFS transporter n=1 Tax=unclassified Ochrobactrum TaxID=239106 RepID=UPI000992EE9E|nr:putative MFS family arabinose efflux permease [Ochrobactrum sp. P6BSIII]OOL19265.1 MFS transporter [Ochrobactrum sp. P6BS-III]
MNDSCESALAAEGASMSRKEARAIPMVVYCLSLGVFALTTSELMISGMMPSLQEAFGRSIADIGNLISLYALGMMIGGPLVTVLFLALKIENKRGLLGLLIFYALAQSVAASTSNFHVLLAARVLTGMAAATSFGLMLAITAQLVAPELRGRASSLVFAGLMLCTVLGVPIATAITNAFGWRASFWSIVVLILLCALVIALKIETTREGPQADLRSELAEMRKPKLWAAYATSALVIGSSFAVYSYLSPITVELAGFSAMQVPFLLAVYGAANIVGNYVSGRFADRHTIVTIFAGLVVMLAAMLIFALFAELKPAAILAIVMIGLTGIALNPAFVARVMRIAHPGALVNAMHASVINIGLGLGPWIGGQAMEAGYGLHAPLWVGFAMTLAGLLTLAPPALRRM